MYLDTEKIEQRLRTPTTERARSNRCSTLVQLNDDVDETGRYRPVTVGKDVYLRKGEKARLRRGQIAFLRID